MAGLVVFFFFCFYAGAAAVSYLLKWSHIPHIRWLGDTCGNILFENS